MKKRNIIMFLGITGSGKSTIARKLYKEYVGFDSVSSGDIVRNLHKELTEKEVQEDNSFISKNGLSKYEGYIRTSIYNKINLSKKRNILLDGYPRTKEQLVELFGTLDDTIYYFVEFTVSPMTALQRIIARDRGEVDPENIIMSQLHNLAVIRQYIQTKTFIFGGDKFSDHICNTYVPLLRVYSNIRGNENDIAELVYKYFKLYKTTIS